jgi:hypothetical protein
MKHCSIEDCNNRIHGKGLCGKHYIAKYRGSQRNAYYAMKNRCYNKNHPRFKDYGARGIRVCSRWLDSYDNFLEDMGKRPEGTTLDRIYNDGNYEPGNCRWADNTTQSLNKRKYKSNKSGVTGVYRYTNSEKWVASIRINGKGKHLGIYDDVRTAIQARLKAELDRDKALLITKA